MLNLSGLSLSELQAINAIFEKPKKLWYNLDGIEYIYHGEWADSEIVYNGYTINSTCVEDGLYEQYQEENTRVSFESWMIANRDLVIESIEYCIENKIGLH